jgi:C1A family cysteine protease
MNLSKYTFPLQKSPVDPRDFMLEAIYPDAVLLPDIWDLRPEMQSIRDQGNQGTCSAQTAAAMKEWQEKIDVGFNGYMSPQFVYNLRTGGEEGMTPKDTMEILYKIGIVPESYYPYETRKKIAEKDLKYAEPYRILGYAQINTIDALKKALYANGPCYIAFPVYNSDKMEFWKQESTTQEMQGGHAVTCVGFLKDCFIIRNSWSTAWGDSGYTYFKFADWGMQWEAWTTLDADSNPEGLNKKLEKINDKQGLFRKIFGKKIKK